jgi:small subunit ribosomal protein S8e
MGISRDHWHKRRKTGGKRPQPHKKRKFELGRPAAMTKLGAQRIHTVRTRGGNKKYRALRLDIGNFSWGSEGIAKKTRIIDVMYHPSNNVRIFKHGYCFVDEFDHVYCFSRN